MKKTIYDGDAEGVYQYGCTTNLRFALVDRGFRYVRVKRTREGETYHLKPAGVDVAITFQNSNKTKVVLTGPKKNLGEVEKAILEEAKHLQRELDGAIMLNDWL
ncbi:MAG TPA: hypothetical protein VKE88_00870 [Candidatus Nanoarchaeia archaeon]|nr:hypothetical protein [Candidatus Nanoarchaeia archaeon]